MRSITEYQDYRAYIADYYAYKKRTSSFTWREFAKLAGFGSPVYLKQVSEGKFNLSESAVERVAEAMRLVGYEVDYFRTMVAYGHAESPSEKHRFFAQMVTIAEENKVEVVGAESFKFFDSYKNVLLRELAPAMPNARPMDMAKACKPEFSAAEASDALKFLVKNGFLIKDKNGNYRQCSKSVKMDDSTAKSLAATELQRQMGELALSAMDYPKTERDMTGLTLGMSEKCYAEVVRELAECRRRIVALVQSDPAVKSVYRLNMQLFPMASIEPCHCEPRRGEAISDQNFKHHKVLNKKHPSPKRRKK